jgi:hypothetical protein
MAEEPLGGMHAKLPTREAKIEGKGAETPIKSNID